MSKSVSITKALPSHIERIANGMRTHDVKEIWSSHRSLPEQALTKGLARGKAWTALLDGEPFVMFGVTDGDLLTGLGIPWLLATDELDTVSRDFLKYTKEYMPQVINGYSRLQNYVHAENTQSILWLKWIGFTLREKLRFGYDNEYFYRFEMRIDYV